MENTEAKNTEFIYDKPLQQSEAWNAFQNRIKRETIYCDKNDYSYLGIYNNTPIGKYLFFPYGPYIKNDNGLKAYDDIISEAKKREMHICKSRTSKSN